MKDPLRIMVPLDGSAVAESILPAILPLGEKTPIQLTLLGAVPKNGSVRSTEAYLAKAEKVLRRQGVEGGTKLCVGDPVDAILRQATPEKADLLAMATHGRRGLKRLVMGSVAEEVVRRATIPLVVSRPRCRMEGWNHVATLDGSPQAEAVLEDLIPLTRLLGVTLHLLHVEPSASLLGSGRRGDAQASLKRMAALARARAVAVQVEVRRGHPGPEILRYALEVRAGLVAMATHGRTGLSRAILGSVAEAVLRKVSCPVMLRRVAGPSGPPETGTVFA